MATVNISSLSSSETVGWSSRSKVTSPGDGEVRMRANDGTGSVDLDLGSNGNVTTGFINGTEIELYEVVDQDELYDYAGDIYYWDATYSTTLNLIVDKDTTIDSVTGLVTGRTYTLKLHYENDSSVVTLGSTFVTQDSSETAYFTLVPDYMLVNVIRFYYDGQKLLPLSHHTYLYEVPWVDAVTSPPNIATDYVDWRWWQHDRLGQFENHCPKVRTTTIYVSNSEGSDGNTGLNTDEAIQTLSAVSDYIGALPTDADVRIRFKRGDMWLETAGLTIDKDNVTFDDYGTGELPFFNRFTVQYPETANVWTLASGNRYTVAETSDIAWIRKVSDRLGTIGGLHISRTASSAACEALSNSFFWGSNVLHINLGGTDPNTIDLEAVISNSESGVEFQGNGCRVENIRGDGWGLNRTLAATQDQPFTNRTSGDDANYYKKLEGYYSGTHLMAHNMPSGSGGISAWVGCKAGLGVYTTGGCSVFNSYSRDGDQETWIVGCRAEFGTLRSNDWDFANLRGIGLAVYAHATSTVTDILRMGVCSNLYIPNSHTPCSRTGNLAHATTPASVSNLTQYNSFYVNCTQENFSGATNETRIDFVPYGVFYGHRGYYQLGTAGVGAYSNAPITHAWMINCFFELNHATVANNTCGFWNTLVTNNSMHILHSAFKIIGGTATNANRFGLDYDVIFAGGVGTGAAYLSSMINSILSYTNTGGGGLYTGLTNVAYNNSTLVGITDNAYYGVTQSTDTERGHNNDPGAVSLGSAFSLGSSQAGLLAAGSTAWLLSHDINGKRRLGATPDIGPEDFSS